MPWLEKDEKNPEKELLFVHVPRCGGTSLIKHFHVEKKTRKGRNCYHKFGLLYFFYRYRVLESANFPIMTWENLISLCTFIIAWATFFSASTWDINACEGERWCPPPLSVSFWVTSTIGFCLNTFVMNAPVMGRQDLVRRFELWLFGKVLCEFCSSTDWMHGIGNDGYLMHYTAPKMLDHGFVTKDRMESANTFAIVRNPYSRMFSLYKYNRFGECETFDHFVREWKVKLDKFRKKGSPEEKDVYCHVLPMKDFTHRGDEQIVPYIIRQEDLKELTKYGGATVPTIVLRYSNLPQIVLTALIEMPHANGRKTKEHWSTFYTQELMDMVYEMYKEDFTTFKYDSAIKQRKDLKPKEMIKPSFFQFQASSRHVLDVSRLDFPSTRDLVDGHKGDIDINKMDMDGNYASYEDMDKEANKVEIVVEDDSDSKAKAGESEPETVDLALKSTEENKESKKPENNEKSEQAEEKKESENTDLEAQDKDTQAKKDDEASPANDSSKSESS